MQGGRDKGNCAVWCLTSTSVASASRLWYRQEPGMHPAVSAELHLLPQPLSSPLLRRESANHSFRTLLAPQVALNHATLLSSQKINEEPISKAKSVSCAIRDEASSVYSASVLVASAVVLKTKEQNSAFISSFSFHNHHLHFPHFHGRVTSRRKTSIQNVLCSQQPSPLHWAKNHSLSSLAFSFFLNKK